MDTPQGSQIITLNDFVTLPIIISDYDAIAGNKRRASNTATSSSDAASSSPRTSETPSAAPSNQRWATGFTAFTDKLWDRMTGDMKQKLRQACVEVLKRTDGAGDQEQDSKMSWQYDDDARFLD